MVKLKNLQLGITFHVCNVYIPNNIREKKDCWETMSKLKDIDAQENCIITREFNTTLHQGEKKGGSIVRDQFRESMEDLITDLDLFDVKPSKGKYTWSNKRSGVGHIPTRLDRFLIHNSLLLLPLDISSKIILWGISYHRPISLTLTKALNYDPIPFRFTPLWMDSPDFLPLISSIWSTWINGTPMFIWEQKLKKTKQALKSWAKEAFLSTKDEVQQHKQKLEEIHMEMEEKKVTQELLA
jgi:hypothetical protein